MIDSNNIEIMRENIRDLMIDDLSSRRSIEEIKENLGDPSEAESVEGESAFSKISTINNKISELDKNLFCPIQVKIGQYCGGTVFTNFRPWNCYFVPIFPNRTYTIKNLFVHESVYITVFDNELNAIQSLKNQVSETITITIPNNNDCAFICINVKNSSSKMPFMTLNLNV